MKNIAKLLIHIAGVLTTMVASGVIVGQGAAVITAVVGLVSAILVYWVPNTPTASTGTSAPPAAAPH